MSTGAGKSPFRICIPQYPLVRTLWPAGSRLDIPFVVLRATEKPSKAVLRHETLDRRSLPTHFYVDHGSTTHIEPLGERGLAEASAVSS